MANLNNPERPGAMSVEDFAKWAGVGRTTAWNEIRLGRLRAIKVGARTLVAFDDAQAWLSSRPEVLQAATKPVRLISNRSS
jgi:excisionase family DNA binding protein